MRRGATLPISLLAIGFLLLMLPVAVFLVGQREGTFNPQNKAFEGGSRSSEVGMVTDDAYVDADIPTQNLGVSTALWVDGSSVKVSYIKFDLSSWAGKTINSAKLKLKVSHSSSGKQTIYATETNWTEGSITFANRPAFGEVLGQINGGSEGDFVEVDLTSYLRFRSGVQAAIAIASDNPNGISFNSKEALTDKPELIVH